MGTNLPEYIAWQAVAGLKRCAADAAVTKAKFEQSCILRVQNSTCIKVRTAFSALLCMQCTVHGDTAELNPAVTPCTLPACMLLLSSQP